MRFVAVAAVVFAVTAGASAAAAPIKGVDAVKKANACLMAHGASNVGGGVVGNGDASFGGMVAFYKYRLAKAWPLQNGAVLGVASISYDKRMTAGRRLVVKRCVYSVVPA